MTEPVFPEERQLAVAHTLRVAITEMHEIASQLYAWNWIDTTGGSLSIRLPQAPDLFALTPTHAGFNRWKLPADGLVVLDKDLKLMPYSTSQRRAHPSAIVHQRVYERLPLAHAILHTHAPHSLAFASLGRSIKPFTLQSQILGEVPCLDSDVDRVGDRSELYIDSREDRMTSGMQGYSYAYAHFEEVLGQLDARLVPRAGELARHGLAFTVFKHGVFVIARNLSEAFDNLIRVERNAQVQLLARNLS